MSFILSFMISIILAVMLAATASAVRNISVLFVGNSLTADSVPNAFAALCRAPGSALRAVNVQVSWAGGMNFQNHAVDPAE